jgi:hypothetical protein
MRVDKKGRYRAGSRHRGDVKLMPKFGWEKVV